MSLSDNFFKAVKDVVTLSSEVHRLTDDVKELRQLFTEMDKRLVRIETMVEISKVQQLSKK